MAGVFIVGSVNQDFVLNVERRPEPGETVTDARLSKGNGGKGANQAAAAALLGASVVLLGRVGCDGFGKPLVRALAERFRFEAREGLNLYTPEDIHDAYRTLGINAIAHPDGNIELTGSVFLGAIHSDSVRSQPFERSQSPLSTGAKRPLLTVTPPPERR